MIETPDITRPSKDLIDGLKEIGSATASGELSRLGIRNPFMLGPQPWTKGQSVVDYLQSLDGKSIDAEPAPPPAVPDVRGTTIHPGDEVWVKAVAPPPGEAPEEEEDLLAEELR